jgi:hypothetical protein
MISRSTLIGALVVVELAILGLAARAVGLSGGTSPTAFVPPGPSWGGSTATASNTLYPTGPAPVVVVDLHDVSVSIETASIGGVRVTDGVRSWGLFSHHVVPVNVERTADGVRISVNDSGKGFFTRISRHLEVQVPPLAQVRVVSAGDVEASGLRTAFSVHDVNDVTVRDHRGDLDVSADRGDITLADVQANTISATTSNGNVTLTRVVTDQLTTHSDDGDITADEVRANGGAVSTADGDVKVSFAPGTDATVNLNTGDGSITVNGARQGDDDGSHAQVVHVGLGRGHLDISSGDGNITTQGATV